MFGRLLILFFSVALAACGSGTAPDAPLAPSQSPGPGDSPPPGGSPPPGSPVVTITATGFSPLEVTVSVGGTVTFVNTDRFPHEIWGGIDHESRDCPEVEVAGFLVPGQSRDTGTFLGPKTCRFHDHTNLGNPAYQGRILVR